MMVINQMRLYMDPLEQESELMNLCEDPCLGLGKVLIVCENEKIADRLARKFSMKTYYNGDYLYNGNGRVSSSFRKIYFMGADKIIGSNIRGMRFNHIILYKYTKFNCPDLDMILTGLAAISIPEENHYIRYIDKYSNDILQDEVFKLFKRHHLDVQIIPKEITVEIANNPS